LVFQLKVQLFGIPLQWQSLLVQAFFGRTLDRFSMALPRNWSFSLCAMIYRR
jgi:hypothetical protein